MTAINFAYFRVLLAASINKSQSISFKQTKNETAVLSYQLDGLF